MWELIIEKDDIGVGYQWFREWENAQAFTTRKSVQAMDMDTQVIHVNGKAVAEMQNFLRAKVVQWSLGNPLSNV